MNLDAAMTTALYDSERMCVEADMSRQLWIAHRLSVSSLNPYRDWASKS